MNEISFHKKKIKFLALDVDGVLTDGGLYIAAGAYHAKEFNVKDGLGIKLALRAGLEVGFISASTNHAIIAARAKQLGVKHVSTGKKSKLDVLTKWIKKLNISLEEVAYCGDDITDIPTLEAVGLAACPADAVTKVKAICTIVLQKEGGKACVRELIDEHILS